MIRLFNLIRAKYFLAYNYLLFALMKVPFKGIVINGKLFFRCYGVFNYGKNLIINSSHAANPIGGSTFCSIVVRNHAVLNIGNNVGISSSAIYCAKNITIGDNVLIGGDCKIYDTDFHSLNIRNRLQNGDKGLSRPVIIGPGVFVGTGSVILKGAEIGENSVIGAGSVVSGIVPANQIWAGNPIKFIKNIQ
jgi:acetyltransferase-like isoleucine patch superfamily enzyme